MRWMLASHLMGMTVGVIVNLAQCSGAAVAVVVAAVLTDIRVILSSPPVVHFPRNRVTLVSYA